MIIIVLFLVFHEKDINMKFVFRVALKTLFIIVLAAYLSRNAKAELTISSVVLLRQESLVLEKNNLK